MYTPKYFTLDELTRSTTATRKGIRNNPGISEIQNIYALIQNTLDPLRELWGGPVTVTSGYRSRALNTAVGGTANSSHLRGEAADITVGGKDRNWELYQKIKASAIPFTKLIFETNKSGAYWLHISFVRQTPTLRKCYIYQLNTKTYKPD